MRISHSTHSQVLKTFPSFSPLLCKVVKTKLGSLLKALKIPNKMLDGEEYSPPAAPTDSFAGLNTRKKKNKNKRRFSDEQIRSLETIFESESKLEPRKKLQVARELGLQPRQVAIWFQNKRARWKSKQLEQDYTILHTNYTTLVSRFEALKKEKQTLILKLQKLHDLMQKPREERQCCIDGESEDGETTNTKCESEVKASLLSLERIEQGVGVLSDDDSSIKAGEYFGLQEEETELLNMVEPADGSLTSTENWGSFDTDGLFDESSSSYQWWDFWS